MAHRVYLPVANLPSAKSYKNRLTVEKVMATMKRVTFFLDTV